MVQRLDPEIILFPIAEIYGPTIQGEGPIIGLPTLFVRFGGCDSRCSWCDSLFAVNPSPAEKSQWERGNAAHILAECQRRLPPMPDRGPFVRPFVTLTGGNPALYDLSAVVRMLDEAGYQVAVETQGTIWPLWLSSPQVRIVVLSPKPPSSGEGEDPALIIDRLTDWSRNRLAQAALDRGVAFTAVKIVVFDRTDLEWAKQIFEGMRESWMSSRCLQVGTPPGATPAQILDRYRELVEWVLADPAFAGVHVLPQMHALLWGHERGR